MKGAGTLFALTIFILVLPTASGYYVVEDSYQAEAKYHSPIVFIPGVMGTILGEDVGGGFIDEAWPGLPHEDRMELGFEDDGKTPVISGTKIVPRATLRNVFGFKPIYEGFFTYMDTYTEYVYRGEDVDDGVGYLRKAYFDHPYDFRLPTQEHLKSGEYSLVTRIDDILLETKSQKVILVAHSMGGLQARMFAHRYPNKVAGIVFLSNPHNGAPRGFESLTQGYNFGAGALVTENHVWQIGRNWPGIYHLMPNKAFVYKDGKQLSLEEVYNGDYISFQQSNNLPDSFMAGLNQEGVFDEATVTKRIKSRYRGISEQIWAETKSFRDDFDDMDLPSSVPFILINGDGQKTTYAFNVTEEVVSRAYRVGEKQSGRGKVADYRIFTFKIWNFERLDEDRGDETVDIHGLTWDKADKIKWVKESHMNVPGNTEAMNWAMDFIEEINHDKRDKKWLNKLESIAIERLSRLQGRSADEATLQSEEYQRRYIAATAGEDETRKNSGYVTKLVDDIRGRGSLVFFHRLVDGKQNNINIVVPGAGDYPDEEDFSAWIALDGYYVVESGIGEVKPASYKITMQEDDFLDLMEGRITFNQAWEEGKVDAGLGVWFADWVADWVRRYT